jgi:hypothetical protein
MLLIFYKTKSNGTTGQLIYPFPIFSYPDLPFIFQSEIQIHLDKYIQNFIFTHAKIAFSIKLLHLEFGN